MGVELDTDSGSVEHGIRAKQTGFWLNVLHDAQNKFLVVIMLNITFLSTNPDQTHPEDLLHPLSPPLPSSSLKPLVVPPLGLLKMVENTTPLRVPLSLRRRKAPDKVSAFPRDRRQSGRWSGGRCKSRSRYLPVTQHTGCLGYCHAVGSGDPPQTRTCPTLKFKISSLKFELITLFTCMPTSFHRLADTPTITSIIWVCATPNNSRGTPTLLPSVGASRYSRTED